MDKDLIILKEQQLESEDVKNDLDALRSSNDKQEDRLNQLKKRLDNLYNATGIEKSHATNKVEPKVDNNIKSEEHISYDELYEQSKESLKNRGLDVDSIDFDDVISDKDLNDLLEGLNEPLPRDSKWNKSDFIVVFTASVIGCVIDFVLGNKDNKLTGKGSKFSDNLNTIHTEKFKHKSGAPIDFQGKINGFSFGGGNHRELSKGHDVLRFVDGIKSFKNGTFEAVAYKNGVKTIVTSTVNQFGNPYAEMSLISAMLEYAHHMTADLFSNNSLPFPGYSFLRESSNRKLRKFSADMYANGFNCKNVIIQSVTTITLEIIIRLYFSIQSVKQYKKDIDINEDYSNWDLVKKFIKPANKDKLNEMLLVAHTIVLAFNVGKIIITKQIQDINVTEIMAVVKYGIKVTKAVANRNSDYAKLLYHAKRVNDEWENIEKEVSDYDEELLAEMKETLIV